MLHFQIDPHSGITIHKQLMDQIKYYIASGILWPGCQLPTIRELARSLTLNPSTIARAYSHLEQDGIIESQQGKGHFIAEIFPKIEVERQQETIRRIARQLLVEARQKGISELDAMQIIEEERVALNPDTDLIVVFRLAGDRHAR